MNGPEKRAPFPEFRRIIRLHVSWGVFKVPQASHIRGFLRNAEMLYSHLKIYNLDSCDSAGIAVESLPIPLRKKATRSRAYRPTEICSDLKIC